MLDLARRCVIEQVPVSIVHTGVLDGSCGVFTDMSPLSAVLEIVEQKWVLILNLLHFDHLFKIHLLTSVELIDQPLHLTFAVPLMSAIL